MSYNSVIFSSRIWTSCAPLLNDLPRNQWEIAPPPLDYPAIRPIHEQPLSARSYKYFFFFQICHCWISIRVRKIYNNNDWNNYFRIKQTILIKWETEFYWTPPTLPLIYIWKISDEKIRNSFIMNQQFKCIEGSSNTTSAWLLLQRLTTWSPKTRV